MSLLTEELPALGAISRPSSPWSTLSNIFQGRRVRSPTATRGVFRAHSGSWSSRIPVLAGAPNRYPSYGFYSDIGADDATILHADEGGVRKRFDDLPFSLKEKMTQGVEGETNGLGENIDDAVWDNYVEEAKECDLELITELNGSLDVLLIFVEPFYHLFWL